MLELKLENKQIKQEVFNEAIRFEFEDKIYEGECIITLKDINNLMNLQKLQEEFTKGIQDGNTGMKIISETLSFVNGIFKINKVNGKNEDFKIEDVNLSNSLLTVLGTQIFPSISKVEKAKTEV